MKRKLSAFLITIVMILNFVFSAGLSAFGAAQTLAAPKLTLKSYATKAVLSWDKNTKADGYQIYWCGGDTSSVTHNNQSGDCWNELTKLKTISSNTTTTYTKTDLSYKKNYHFKVRAYKKSDSTTIYSDWSNDECTIDTVNRLNAASLKTRNSYKTINTQGSKNTTFADHTLTDKEKSILKSFADKHFKDNWTPGEKVVYTAEWIRNNMTYLQDYSQIKTYSYTENIFKYKEGQCSDYNGALVEMMIYLGFDARLIMGYRSGGWQHFWGEVIIDGSVFLMEVGEKASDSPQWGYKWEFLCNTYSESDGGYTKNGQAAKDSIASYPAVVTGLKASSKTIDTVNLSWTKVSGAAGYYIYQYDNSQKKFVRIARTTTTANTYKISKLSAGTEYKFAVKAYKTANGQEISSVSYPTLTVVTNPAAVTGFKVSSTSSDYVKLSWDTVKSAQGYIIYQYDNAKKTWLTVERTSGSLCSYTVKNLSSSKEYKFAVKAYRIDDKEVYSPSYPTVTAVTNPAAVVNLKASSTDSTVKLSWSSTKSAQGYIIYKYDNSKNIWSRIAKTNNTLTSYTVNNLDAGKEYKFAVKAYRIVNNKELSSSSYPKISVITKLTEVRGFKYSSTDTNVKLSWNKLNGAQGYIIYKYNPSKNTWTRLDKTSSVSYTVKDLKSGSAYKFAVKGFKTVNGKEVSSVTYPSLTAVTRPDMVTGLKVASNSANSVKLEWDKNSSATGYIVYQYNTADKSWKRLAKITGTSYTVSKLSSGTSYKFAIKPYVTSSGKEIVGSKITQILTSTLPDKVNFMVKTEVDKTTVTWDKVKGATGYIVYYKKNSSDKWNKLTDTTKTSYTNSKLARNKNYIFTVKAYRVANGVTYNGKYSASAFPYIVKKNGLTYVDGILIANKTYGLPSDYNPGLDAKTQTAFNKMKNDAAKSGISLYIASGFRSYNTQKTLYNNYVYRDGKAAAERYSARPGYSEHQTGLAIDVNNASSSFVNTKEAKWLEQNCWKYGFIIRYPKGKESITGYQYEPWHIRYVGTSLAKVLKTENKTLEEFYSIKSKYAN